MSVYFKFASANKTNYALQSNNHILCKHPVAGDVTAVLLNTQGHT